METIGGRAQIKDDAETFGRYAEKHAKNLSLIGLKFSYHDGNAVGLAVSYDFTSGRSTVQWENKPCLQEEDMLRIISTYKPTFEQIAPTDALWTPAAKEHMAPVKKRRIAASVAALQMDYEPPEFEDVVPKPKKERRLTIDEKHIECPITQQVMNDPVLCDDGHHYERSAIERHLQTSNLSPVTRQPIRGTVKEDFTMKAIIDAWGAARK
jgi:hypothetical protein